jgi:hypothetical protein
MDKACVNGILMRSLASHNATGVDLPWKRNGGMYGNYLIRVGEVSEN